jgi:phenylalanyl-tRNA synthetase alpha chain
VETLQGYDLTHPECNVPPHIAARVGANIHLQPNHPLHIIKTLIESYWQQKHLHSGMFQTFDKISPIVSTFENFDSLLIPKDHGSRTKSDSYYIREDTMLRTHTSAHQTFLLKAGLDQFLVTGSVYRFVCFFFFIFVFHPCERITLQ